MLNDLISRLFAVAAIMMCGCVVIHVDDHNDVATRVQTDVEMMRQALAEIRSLSTAFEAFAVDYNFYPAATVTDRTVDDIPLSNVERLPADFGIYIRVLPRLDPWDSPYLYWSDGQRYALISLGADAAAADPRLLADALRAIAQGGVIDRRTSHCVEDEILLANGILAWMPRDPVRRCP